MTPGRSLTQQQKRATIERILAAWQALPMLRLGQLIESALSDRENRKSPKRADLFFVEDDDLADQVTTMAARHTRRPEDE